MSPKQPSAAKWFSGKRAHPAPRLRLFCFPYGGGGASIYRQWQLFLPDDVELCLVNLPGREARFSEAPFCQVGPMAAALAGAIEPLLDRPAVFFGHCMGALAAFELARELRRNGQRQPTRLLVSGRTAPQIAHAGPFLHALGDADLTLQLRAMGGTPEALLGNAGLMRALAPMLRADFSVTENYVYGDEAPLPCPIDAFGGAEDAFVTAAQLDAWRVQTTAQCSSQIFPGGHFFLNAERERLLAAVVAKLAP